MKQNNLQLIKSINAKILHYDIKEIEASVIEYVCMTTKKKFVYEDGLEEYYGISNKEIIKVFQYFDFPVCIEFIVEFFEILLDQDNINENGIVFTPEYISKHIFNQAIKNNNFSEIPKVLDPSCGCGIFLATAASSLKKIYNVSFQEIFKNNIFGIEVDPDNAKRCKIVLHLLPLIHNESNCGIKVNIICTDSLKSNWSSLFNVNGFDLIIGNPPYVNTHNMAKDTVKFLKENFTTTKSGVYNIFYAFIEHGYKFLLENAILSYIVPNNFLTIKSARDLRKFISNERCLKRIIDLSNNMVFKPVRTYNCIIQIEKAKRKYFEYYVFDNEKDIKMALDNICLYSMSIESLDDNGWKLVDKNTIENIYKIEGQFQSIKSFIRTGIATLKDNVYIVEKDDRGFYKEVDGRRFDLEGDIIKNLYKIPELKNDIDLKKLCRYIIFPYKKFERGFKIIDEDTMSTQYPCAYSYLRYQKEKLDRRDKGKQNSVAWYAYGRTQGLNKYGVKLLFPTFSNKPKFTFLDDEYAFFCNGYAVFESDEINLRVLQRVLNSKVMDYYVKNTSYSIEGGYFCYQKKYIEKFSIPYFTEREQNDLLNMSDKEFDNYLLNLYNINI